MNHEERFKKALRAILALDVEEDAECDFAVLSDMMRDIAETALEERPEVFDYNFQIRIKPGHVASLTALENDINLSIEIAGFELVGGYMGFAVVDDEEEEGGNA